MSVLNHPDLPFSAIHLDILGLDAPSKGLPPMNMQVLLYVRVIIT